MSEQLKNPATIIALTALGTAGVTSAMAFKRMTDVENQGLELRAHVANFGKMLDKYPTGEVLAGVSSTIEKLQHDLMVTSRNVEFLHQQNRQLHLILSEVLKVASDKGIDLKHIQLTHKLKMTELNIVDEKPQPQRQESQSERRSEPRVTSPPVLDDNTVNRIVSARRDTSLSGVNLIPSNVTVTNS